METEPIVGFFAEFRFLSNFWPCPVEYEGRIFPSVENAYQASKFKGKPEFKEFLTLTAGKAKRKARKAVLPPNWDEIKVGIMRELVFKKFRNPEMRAKLIETGERELIEGNTWGDTFWGVCNGVGENHLGKILMEARAEMGKEESSQPIPCLMDNRRPGSAMVL